MLVGAGFSAMEWDLRENVGMQLTSGGLPCFAGGARLPRVGVRRAVQLWCAHVEEQSFLEVVHHSQTVTVS